MRKWDAAHLCLVVARTNLINSFKISKDRNKKSNGKVPDLRKHSTSNQ
jgi:hypothetical protein